MKSKNKFILKQAIKYTVLFLMVIGAIIFYSLVYSMSKELKVVTLATIIGIVLIMLIIDIISFKDIWGIFGRR